MLNNPKPTIIYAVNHVCASKRSGRLTESQTIEIFYFPQIFNNCLSSDHEYLIEKRYLPTFIPELGRTYLF